MVGILFVWLMPVLTEYTPTIRVILVQPLPCYFSRRQRRVQDKPNGKRFDRVISAPTECPVGALPETPLELLGPFVEGGVLLDGDPLSHFGQRGQAEKLVSDLPKNK